MRRGKKPNPKECVTPPQTNKKYADVVTATAVLSLGGFFCFTFLVCLQMVTRKPCDRPGPSVSPRFTSGHQLTSHRISFNNDL